MNKQRKVLITVTYNEMGIIIDTKAEEVAQLNLQPTCNQLATDTISRQAAIDALDVLCQEHRYRIPGKVETYSQYNEAWQDALDRAEGAIGNLPSAQPEQRWIPCKTALPKEDGQYIVTVKYEHVDGYEDIYSEHGEWVDGHWDAGYGHCGRVEKVLAWQPLPTPWEGA